MECYYNLNFMTYLGKTASIRVPFAALVDSADVKAAMKKILDSGIIAVSAGLLKSVENAEYVEIEYVPCVVS